MKRNKDYHLVSTDNNPIKPTSKKQTNVVVYYGEHACEDHYKSGKNKGKGCKNGAYFEQNGKYLCGQHSNKDYRKKLKKNPKADEIREQEYKDRGNEIAAAAKTNRTNHCKGRVQICKMKMRKNPEYVSGYLMVFPNYRHQNRKDGYGCKSLSPKSIGPIDHGMPDLPIAKNLENYHQGAKVFSCELDYSKQNPDVICHSIECSNASTKSDTKALRIKMYNDTEPYRHKYQYPGFPIDLLDVNKMKNKNIPAYSCYYDKKGVEHRYNYLQCRYFYCHWYEKAMENNKDFAQLKKIYR